MTTYAVMKTRIADEIRRTDLSSQIAQAVLDAIKAHERRGFYFNQSTFTFSTVASQEYYGSADTLSPATAGIDDFISIRSLKVTVDGVKDELTPLTFDEIDLSQDGTVTGDPFNYCHFLDRIRLYPIPNAIRTMTAVATYKLAALSADGDSNAWTTDAEMLIRNEAKLLLAADVIHDENLASRSAPQAQRALRELIAETARRASSGAMLRTDVPAQAGAGLDINLGG